MQISLVGLVPRAGSPGCNPRVKTFIRAGVGRRGGRREGGTYVALQGHSWASLLVRENPVSASPTPFTSRRRGEIPVSLQPPRRRPPLLRKGQEKLREQQDWPWSFPRPSHLLPASLLGNKGASGSWAHLVPGPTPTPALLMWNRVWALPGYCLRWGRGRAEAGNSARSLLHQVPHWRSLPNRRPASAEQGVDLPN